MDRIIGKGKITANRVVVLSKILNRVKIRLSFNDEDAIPFGSFPIYNNMGNITNKFYLGKKGQTHCDLLQQANMDNQELLGSDWMYNSKYTNIVKGFGISCGGRIWTDKEFFVMRSCLPVPQMVEYVKSMLEEHEMNLESYKMLYSDSDNRVHCCSINDYINGCASKFGYKTNEIVPNHTVQMKHLMK